MTTKKIITGVYKQSALILAPLCIISLFFVEWRFSFSLAVGGAIGAGNLSGLAWSIGALLGTEKAGTKMVLLSVFKLLLIFSVLLLLALLKLLNPFGLLAGLTVVMAIIIKEGLRSAKQGG